MSEESGRILGRATTGPSNYSALGIDVAAERVAEAIRSALCDAALGAAPPQIAGICLALAGVARPDDHRTWRTALAGLMDGGSVRAQWDTTAEDISGSSAPRSV